MSDVEGVSTVEERNTDLFFEIADVLDLTPESYNQETWGEFDITPDMKEKYRKATGMTPYNDAESKWLEIGCGGVMCVAGWAAQMNGYLPQVSTIKDQRFTDGRMIPVLDWSSVNIRTLSFLNEKLPSQPVQEVALQLLGITYDEAEILFSGSEKWTGDDLRAFGKGEIITALNPDEDYDE